MIDDFNPGLKKGNSTKQFLDRPQETDTTLGTFEILSVQFFFFLLSFSSIISCILFEILK